MTPRTTRVLIAVLATTLTAATLGCGLISKVKDIAGTAQVLSNFADRLGKAAQLTYTAEYKVDGDDKATSVTLVQQPPNTALLTKDGRYIATADSLYFCGAADGTMTCQKSANNAATATAGQANVAAVAGAGFVTPEIALGLIAAAALVPGASVSQSDKTIAGEKSLCATASNLDAAASPGDKDAPKDFTVCVTDAGILASFSGTLAEGKKSAIELTKYSTTVDASAFAPPAGAKIVDVTVIAPTP